MLQCEVELCNEWNVQYFGWCNNGNCAISVMSKYENCAMCRCFNRERALSIKPVADAFAGATSGKKVPQCHLLMLSKRSIAYVILCVCVCVCFFLFVLYVLFHVFEMKCLPITHAPGS
ncbi:hypothetical protein NQD34_013294 [Periophthalmus magnuspinnatus]|nr:hypothetical protein NQD34_013294 [Periophthalmus magnuspinnatus]